MLKESDLNEFARLCLASRLSLDARVRRSEDDGLNYEIDERALDFWDLRIERTMELLEDWKDVACRLLMARNASRFSLPQQEDFGLRRIGHQYARFIGRYLSESDPSGFPMTAQLYARHADVERLRANQSPYGPSISFLMRKAGKNPPYSIDDFSVVLEWALGPVPELTADLERKDWLAMKEKFARKLHWVQTDSLDIPWEATVAGSSWQVRLNDFPNRLPFTLLIDGSEAGTFIHWPKAWKRPEAELATPAVKAAADAGISANSDAFDPLTWARRFSSGEVKAVWGEIESLKDRIQEEAYKVPALAVARETVARVHRNLQLLLERLRVEKYEFGVLGMEEAALGSPSEADREAMDQLLAEGPLPLLLLAWYEVFGSVNLAGRHKKLAFVSDDPLGEEDYPLADPLVMFRLSRALEESGPGALELSFSAEIKAGSGGGDSLAVPLPQSVANPKIFWGATETTLLEYLRTVLLEWSGFPGWRHHPDAPNRLLHKLRRGFETF